MSIEGLEEKVIKWAYDRGIFAESTESSRWSKFFEEVEEFTDVVWCEHPSPDGVLNVNGDVLVTLINLLHPYGLDLETCLAAAYDKIKDRAGRMVNGTYVKSEDLA